MKFQNRKVVDVVISGKYEDDLMVESAIWDDTGVELTDDELDDLQDDCAGEIYEKWHERISCMAYDYYKGM